MYYVCREALLDVSDQLIIFDILLPTKEYDTIRKSLLQKTNESSERLDFLLKYAILKTIIKTVIYGNLV